jgi:hypothetical protein
MSTATPLLLLAACLLGGCERGAPGAQAREELAVRARTFDERLAAARQGDGDEPVARWDLPAMLAEISGLALTADGRLLTHGDETGDVYEIDYRTGLVARRFSLGPDPVTEDFEAISVRDSVVTLFTSKARLFEFGEGRNESSVPFTTRELVLDDADHDAGHVVVARPLRDLGVGIPFGLERLHRRQGQLHVDTRGTR